MLDKHDRQRLSYSTTYYYELQINILARESHDDLSDMTVPG